MSLDLALEISRDYKKQAFLRDEGRCRYCGLDFLHSLSAFWSYTADHIVAKSVGGRDILDNVVISCKACNEALCRAGHLLTFEDRLNYIASREADRTPIYQAWCDVLGRGG
ncbi:HNH endonuclease [Lysobacter ciconiae]|uniref:HNH endonuclease n=2 Tax=Novilysobacter ciconiae TaxID=2781022 RepID=A0A7S6UG25_9GAMM|nr:HNH endonuclease [Lysobacter ciconiae]